MPENETREEGKRLTEATEEQVLPPPPDGGYGWVIVAASFMCNLVVDGIGYSFGIFLPELVKYFNLGKGTVAWVGSLLAGMLLVAGPIVSALCNKYGCRAVCIAGAITSCVAFVLSSYCTSVVMMMLTYGIMGGFGFGMIYLPSIVAVGYYFDTKRSLATGIAVCGSGVGTFSFAPMAAYLLKALESWQKANLVLAGIILSCAIWGFLMKPLTFPDEGNDAKPQGLEVIEENQDSNKQQPENGSVMGSSHRLPRNVSSPVFSSGLTAFNKRGSVPSLNQRKQSYGDNLQKPDLLLHGSDPHLYQHCKQSIEFGGVYNSKLSVAREPPKMIRPLSRKDIFYSGSVHNLMASQKSLHAFRKSMASIPQSVADVEKQDQGNCCTNALGSMMDTSLLKDPAFMLIGLSNFFGMAGLYVPFVYLVDAAKFNGVDASSASLLLSIIGVTNTFARIGCGFIADFPWMDSLVLNNACLAIATVAVGLTPFCTTYITYICVAVAFGIAIAGYISLTSIILVDLLGLDKLTNAFGLLILFRGIATVIGSPLAGAVFDMTKTYDASFYIGGGFFLLSTLASVAAGFFRQKPVVAAPAAALAPIDEDEEGDDVHSEARRHQDKNGYGQVPANDQESAM
ncbi:major facilitator superfamily domain-containing protein [Phthorimaea operculella]|nr:major facilitator superfamily domain-containing protein [Phthorimaea operculella]